ncbi:MAG: HmuY family protein [Bacteroidales bacterium]
MKALFLSLSIVLLALTSCSKNDPVEEPPAVTKEAYIDATSKTTWHYFSLSENKVVGTGEETESDNQLWAARSDWDLAINRYSIRTNSGAATTVASKGGVYTFDAATVFSAVTAIPAGISFVADKAVTSEGMGGTTTMVKSAATVIVFKANDDGSLVMPPVYLQAPVYIFRTADGTEYFKVQFFQYQDENKVTGHVKFYSAQIK